MRFKTKSTESRYGVDLFRSRARFRDIVRPQLTDVLIRKFGRTANRGRSAPCSSPAEIAPPPSAPSVHPEPRSNRLVSWKTWIVIGAALACVVFCRFSRPVPPVESAKSAVRPDVVQACQPSLESQAEARTHIANASKLLDEAEYSREPFRSWNTCPNQLAPVPGGEESSPANLDSGGRSSGRREGPTGQRKSTTRRTNDPTACFAPRKLKHPTGTRGLKARRPHSTQDDILHLLTAKAP